MTWWQSLVLGLVQGLAEFLPISSSGHLVLAREIMQMESMDSFLLFDTLLHASTLLAIFVAFFKDLLGLFKPPFKTLGLIVLASIPAAIIGFVFQSQVEGLLGDGKYICFFFAFSAVLMLCTEIIGKRIKNPKPVGLKTSLMMGVMQAVAIFPGITRSGSTIFGGITGGGERKQVAKFSFFMSIPVILGATVLQLFKLDGGSLGLEWWCYVIGMGAAFVSGFAAIKLMMRLIAKANFKWFALYLGVISIITFITLFLPSV